MFSKIIQFIIYSKKVYHLKKQKFVSLQDTSSIKIIKNLKIYGLQYIGTFQK